MKKRALSLLLTLLALAGLLSAAGCSLGRSPRPDFYMLSSPAENSVLSGKEKISGPRVAIGPVAIPGYLTGPSSSCVTAMTSKSSWPSSTTGANRSAKG